MKRSSRRNGFVALRSHLVDSFRQLNLFEDHPYWSTNLTHYQQIHSTRLFVLLISICLLILATYSSLNVFIHEVTLDKFSLDDFERLEKLHSQTISVPCTQTSILFDQFLNLSPIFHQVCSSPFVSTHWISSLFLPNATSHNILDFRTYGFAQYRALKLFCRIAQQTVEDNHRTFNTTFLTNRHAFSREQFNEIASVLWENFHRNLLTSEKQTDNLISMMIAQNHLISALRTNSYIRSKPGSRSYVTYNGAYLHENQSNDSMCQCQMQSNQCFYPAGAFYNWTTRELAGAAKDDPPPAFRVLSKSSYSID